MVRGRRFHRRATTTAAILVASLRLSGEPDARATEATLPPGCAAEVGDLAGFVRDLEAAIGSGDADRPPMAEPLDPAAVRAHVAALGLDARRALAAKLLTVARDPSLLGDCDRARVRYNAAMVLSEIATAAAAERGSSARPGAAADLAYFLDCLLAAAEAEEDPAARRQWALNLDRLTSAMRPDQRARAARLIEEQFPSSPHYASLFGADGRRTVVDVVVHSADREGRFDFYRDAFHGSPIRRDGRDLVIDHVVTPDDPARRLLPVTFRIRVRDEHAGSTANFDIFRDMDKEEPAVEVFNFHSQYGSSLSRSIRRAAENRDARKVYLLANCRSHVNAGRIEAAYPRLGGIYTREGQYMSDTPRAVKRLLAELANRATWTQIRRGLDRVTELQPDNYLVPDDRRKLLHVDADRDGVPDLYDTGIDCGRVEPPSTHAVAARAPVAPVGLLSGEKIGYAVGAANGILAYSEAFERIADRFVADGWAPADPGGPVARLERVREDGPYGRREVVKVRVNAAYSHLSDTALTGSLLREMVLFEAARDGRRPTRDDEIGAFAAAVKLFDAWADNQGGREAFESFQNAFSLGRRLSFWEASSTIDHDRGVTRETIEGLRAKVDRPS